MSLSTETIQKLRDALADSYEDVNNICLESLKDSLDTLDGFNLPEDASGELYLVNDQGECSQIDIETLSDVFSNKIFDKIIELIDKLDE